MLVDEEKGHIMRYDAGVEEFLALVRNAECVVTNSFHGMIFSVQFRRPFVVFSRAQCDNKLEELLGLLGLRDRLMVKGDEKTVAIDYDCVHEKIEKARKVSVDFLEMELGLL